MDEMEIRHAWKWQIGARGLGSAKSGPPAPIFPPSFLPTSAFMASF